MFIPRKRLSTAILENASCSLVQAGAGFGKSVLLRQLAQQDRRLVVVPGPFRGSVGTSAEFLAALRSAANHSDDAGTGTDSVRDALAGLVQSGRVPALDDLDLWEPAVVVGVARAAETASGPIVATSRTLLDTLTGPQWQHLGTDKLAFTRNEVVELLAGLSDHDAMTGSSVIVETTGGWPAPTMRAVSIIGRAVDPVAELGAMARSASALDLEVQNILSALEAEDQASLSVLNSLPSFDRITMERVGGPKFDSVVRRAGLPLLPAAGGWYRIPAECRRAIKRMQGSGHSATDEVLAHLVQSGQPMIAINACLGAGEPVRAARLIAGMSYDDEQSLPPDELNAAIDTIGDGVKEAPRCLYVQSHVNAVNGDSFVGKRAIERAVAIHEAQDPHIESQEHLEALVILGMFHAFERDHAAAQQLLERCEPHIHGDHSDGVTARFHELAALQAQGLGDAELDDAYHHLQQALTIWRRLGHSREAASTAFRLATAVMVEMGRRYEALQLLESLPELGPLSPIMKARLNIESAKLLPYLGRADEVPALLEEPRQIAQLLDQEAITALADVAEAIAATFLDDDQRIETLAQAVRQRSLTVQTAEETAVHHGLLAVALSRAGQTELAQEFLHSAMPHLARWLREISTAFLGAWSNDAESALASLQELSVDADVVRSERWAIAFHQAIACLRLGRQEKARKYLDEARSEAAALGTADLVEVVEWRRLAWFEDAPALESEEALRIQLSLFGPFRVRSGEREIKIAGQLSRTLLKSLGVNGGRLVVDQVVDLLWPEVDLVVGRRRLRNVLLRVRDACGDIVLRNDDLLVLADTVTSDHTEASDAAQLALRSGSLDELKAAIALVDQPLLSDDRYDEWAESARNDQRTLVMRLLDAHADAAEAAGDINGAVSSLVRADGLELVPGRRQARIQRLSS